MGDESPRSLRHDSSHTSSASLNDVRAGIMVIDPGGTCIYVNHECTALTGFTLEDVLANQELCGQIHAVIPDLPTVSAVSQETEKKSARDSRLSIRCRDGRIKEFFVRAVSRRDGTVVTLAQDLAGDAAVLTSGREGGKAEGRSSNEQEGRRHLEERSAEARLRRAEEEYRDFFENSVLGIVQTTPEGGLINANRAAARLYGYESPEKLTSDGDPAKKMIFPSGERLTEFLKLMEQQGSVEGFEGEIQKKDGSLRWVSLNVRVVRDEIGKTSHFEGTIQEITERKILESQLLQSQKMEAIGTLAGGVAHDFNNLLMGIQGYTSLMLFNMDPGHEHYERLRNIEHLVRSGADLTKQLLGFARGGRYEIKVTDLREVLSNVAAMFMRTKREITVHEKYESNLYPVEIDRSQIEHAFLNLYVNAWQAMPSGGHLYIEAQNATLDRNYRRLYSMEPGQYVKVSVTDTGVGMDEKTMERIFEPFFTTKEMGRGTGLGLASVYGIIKGHKGFINVYSQLGHGTTFNVYLPASKKESPGDSASPEEFLAGTETLLLVDDEETILKVGREMIEALGYKVIVASGGLEAIDIFARRKNEIDVVILDMIMPDFDGGRTFDAMKSLDPDVKVILSSGYSLNTEAEGILERGCKAFIQKPFDVLTLSRVLRETLDDRSQE